jgi:hypothetical protein
MTAQEILDKLPELFDDDISLFAYGEEIDIPEDFEFSEDTEVKRKAKEEAYDAWKNHPGFNDSNARDDEYQRLFDVYRALPSYKLACQNEYLEHIGIGPIEEIKQKGGEGQGEEWYSIKYFPKHNIYIRVDGFYTSYHGTDFEEGWGEEVKPLSPWCLNQGFT